MLNNSKAWWTLVLIQCTFLSVVLGAYWGIKTNFVALRAEVHSVELRVLALEKTLNAPGSIRPVSNASAVVNSQLGALQNAPTNTVNAPSGEATAGAADSAHDSSVCVNKMTHLVFPCEKANKCLGSNNFDGAYFKGLRAKLALRDSDTMLICDEKSAESPPTDDTPGQ